MLLVCCNSIVQFKRPQMRKKERKKRKKGGKFETLQKSHWRIEATWNLEIEISEKSGIFFFFTIDWLSANLEERLWGLFEILLLYKRWYPFPNLALSNSKRFIIPVRGRDCSSRSCCFNEYLVLFFNTNYCSIIKKK